MLFSFFLWLLTRSKPYFSAVGLLCGFLLIGAYGDLGTEVHALSLFEISNMVGVAILLRPLIAALPVSFFLMREWGTKYYQSALLHGSCLRYSLSKPVAVFAVGFSVPLLANLLLFITILVVSPAQIFNLNYPTCGGVFPNLVNSGHTNLALVLYILWYSLAGGIWAVIDLCVSLLTTNGYVLVAAPFLLERVFSYMIQAAGRTKPFLNYFDTSLTFALRQKNGVLIHLLICVFLCAFAALSVHAALKRRLRHG